MSAKFTMFTMAGLVTVTAATLPALAGEASPGQGVTFGNYDPSKVILQDAAVNTINQPAMEYETAIRFTAPVSCLLLLAYVPVYTYESAIFVPIPPPGTIWGHDMQAAIYADNNGTPGALLEQIDAPGTVVTWDPYVGDPHPMSQLNFGLTTTLHAGQSYWLGLIETNGTALFWGGSEFVTPQLQTHRTVGDAGWNPSTLGHQAFLIGGFVVPAPIAWPLLMTMSAMMRTGRRRRGGSA